MTEKNKILYVSWRGQKNGVAYPVARYIERPDDPRYEFAYIRGALEAQRDGFDSFIGFPDLDQVYYGDALFPLFSNRLMAPTRPDYEEYLGRLGLGPGTADPFTILARCEGRRHTDNIELFGLPDFDKESGKFIYRFIVRDIGQIKHAEERIKTLKPGGRILYMLDPRNPTGRGAIALTTLDHQLLGFAPRYLGDEMERLSSRADSLEVFIDKVNLPPAPLFQMLLCRFQAPRPDGFKPLSVECHHPISPKATKII